MKKKEINKKIILYLIKSLGDYIEGRKKIMKLMFLLEHYDFDNKKITKDDLIGNSFSVYYYGVFSRDIQICLEELLLGKEIENDFPIKINKKIILEELDERIKDKLDKIIRFFGKETGYSLEVKTLKMMGIDPSDKKKYFGRSVIDLI